MQQSFEIGRLQDRITELLDERQDLYAQINNDQAVPDTQQKLTDTYYLEGSDYVVDCPFEYDIEIDKGEVLELQNGNVLSQQKYILQISIKMKITLKFFNSLQKPKLKMQLQKT